MPDNDQAQGAETEDFNAMFEDAKELDDGPSYKDNSVQTGEDPAAVDAADTDEPAAVVADGLEDDDFYDTDAPLESPDLEAEPELTEDEAKAQRRQDLLDRQRAIQREALQFQEEFGEPVIPKEVQDRIAKGEQALATVKADLPEVLDAVEHLVEQRVEAVTGMSREEMAANNYETHVNLHENAITAVHPEYVELKENPAPVLEWIDALPGKFSKEYQAVFENGSTDDIIGLLNDFKAYPDPAQATAALEAAAKGDELPAPAAQQNKPKGGRQSAPARNPRKTNVPEAALAVRGRGSRSVPNASGQPGSDEFATAYEQFGAEERAEARSA